MATDNAVEASGPSPKEISYWGTDEVPERVKQIERWLEATDRMYVRPDHIAGDTGMAATNVGKDLKYLAARECNEISVRRESSNTGSAMYVVPLDYEVGR